MERLQTYVESQVQVRYAETDAMGIVHHSSYVVWLEVGRTELMRVRGLSYREFEDRGLLIVLSDLQVRYHAPAKYDDTVTIHTSPSDVRSRQFSFDYVGSHAASGARLFSARTTHMVIDRETRRPVRLPEYLLELLG